MNVRTASRPWSRPSRGRRAAVAAAVVALGLAGLTACDSASGSDGPKLAADAAIPDKVPSGTVLRVGDPATQTAIEASGLDEELKDEGVEVEWANISGGPKTLEAFRADAIDVGSVADIPPLFAHVDRHRRQDRRRPRAAWTRSTTRSTSSASPPAST